MLTSCALALDVLSTESLVTALAATCGTHCITGVALHANLAVEQAGLCFRESCHGKATNSHYLITTEASNTGQYGLFLFGPLSDVGAK